MYNFTIESATKQRLGSRMPLQACYTFLQHEILMNYHLTILSVHINYRNRASRTAHSYKPSGSCACPTNCNYYLIQTTLNKIYMLA